MTPILSEARGKKGSNYGKLFNNDDIGRLISKVQSAVITSGTEIEKSIEAACMDAGILIDDLEEFASNPRNGVHIATKKTAKGTDFAAKGKEPDYIVFDLGKERICHIIELKWGTDFDTKKAQGEIAQLRACRDHISARIEFKTSIHMVSFTANSRNRIVEGFKGFVDKDVAMTGHEFCDMLGISYKEIEKPVSRSFMKNRKFFVSEIFKIKEIWPEIMEEIGSNIEFQKALRDAGHS